MVSPIPIVSRSPLGKNAAPAFRSLLTMRFLPRILLLILTALSLAACERLFEHKIPGYRSQGELKVAMREDGIGFRKNGPGELEGLEYDLLVEFAKQEGVALRVVRYPDATRALRAVEAGEAHLAAGSITWLQQSKLLWSAPLRREEYVLATQEDALPINGETDLSGRTVGVRRGSPAAAELQEMARRVSGIKLILYADSSDSALIDRLRRGLLDVIATDRSQLALIQGLYPDVTEVMDLQIAEDIRWAMPVEPADALGQSVSRFLDEAGKTGLLLRSVDRYLTALRRLSIMETDSFLLRIGERLPRLKAHFHEAQALTGIDWRFLAALAYQESQWDPLAKSFTGVRGIMMLTETTADHLGIDDRLDPRQSIIGGARYFQQLSETLGNIPDPDRQWIATAAYNLGPGHLNAGLKLTGQLGKDPQAWTDVRAVLPMLSRPRYAARLRGASPRGGEAVVMAENVRSYFELLKRVEPPYNPPLDTTLAPSRQDGGLQISRGGSGLRQAAGGSSSRPPM